MAEPFGDQERDGPLGKRPPQTIEGTATEVSVDQAPSDDNKAEASAEPAASPETEPILSPEEKVVAAEEPVAEQPKARKGPPPRTSSSDLRSFFTHLAAGALGGLAGVLALALAWGLPQKERASPDLSAVEQRLAKLEGAPASASDEAALAALDQRLAALENRKAETPADLTELSARVSKLEASLDSLAKTAEAGGSVADAAALDAKLGEIEQGLDGKIEAALSAQDAAHGKSLETVESEIETLKAKLGALAEAKLEASETDLSPELANLDQRIAKLETALPDIVTAVDRGAASAKSGAAAMAFANLRDAVDSGRSYAPELAAFNALAPKAGNLGVLPDRAGTGIPTAAELNQSLREAIETGAPAAGAADGSFIDSVIASAKSAVRIRRVDDAAASNGPDATMQRAEGKLDAGDLAAAVKEIEALPASSQAGLAPWLDNARARLSADETLAKLQATVLSSLGGKAGEAKP